MSYFKRLKKFERGFSKSPYYDGVKALIKNIVEEITEDIGNDPDFYDVDENTSAEEIQEKISEETLKIIEDIGAGAGDLLAAEARS